MRAVAAEEKLAQASGLLGGSEDGFTRTSLSDGLWQPSFNSLPPWGFFRVRMSDASSETL